MIQKPRRAVESSKRSAANFERMNAGSERMNTDSKKTSSGSKSSSTSKRRNVAQMTMQLSRDNVALLKHVKGISHSPRADGSNRLGTGPRKSNKHLFLVSGEVQRSIRKANSILNE